MKKPCTCFNDNTSDFLESLKCISKCFNKVTADIDVIEKQCDGRKIKHDVAVLRHSISLMAKYTIDKLEKNGKR